MVRGIVLVLALLLCARELAALAAPLPAEMLLDRVIKVQPPATDTSATLP